MSKRLYQQWKVYRGRITTILWVLLCFAVKWSEKIQIKASLPTLACIWKLAKVIPIPKPNKDTCTSYRPISLPSPLAKIFEKSYIINTAQVVHKHCFKVKHSTKTASDTLNKHNHNKLITKSHRKEALDMHNAFDTEDTQSNTKTKQHKHTTHHEIRGCLHEEKKPIRTVQQHINHQMHQSRHPVSNSLQYIYFWLTNTTYSFYLVDLTTLHRLQSNAQLTQAGSRLTSSQRADTSDLWNHTKCPPMTSQINDNKPQITKKI